MRNTVFPTIILCPYCKQRFVTPPWILNLKDGDGVEPFMVTCLRCKREIMSEHLKQHVKEEIL